MVQKKIFLKYKITYLEMDKRPSFNYPICPIKCSSLEESKNVPIWYFLSLYKAVGEKYEWTDVLKQKNHKTIQFLNNSNVFFFSLFLSGVPGGFYILDYRSRNQCDISYIGLTKENIGLGLGKYLFKTAILTAWDKKKIKLLTVNTCSLDHKNALPLYQKFGFQPIKFKNKTRLKTYFM